MANSNLALADVAEPKGLVGGPFGSSLVGRDYTGAGIPVIRGANLDAGVYVGGDFVFVSEEKFARDLARNSARAGDLIFTQRGTLGQVAMVPQSSYDRYVISQSQMRLRVDWNRADPVYVYYACRSEGFLKQVQDNAIATGVPHINLGILGRLVIPGRPLSEQRAIAEVLKAIDDKIAANQEVVGVLRGQERLLFRHVVGAWSERVSMSEIATVTKGVSYRSVDLDESSTAMVTLKSISRDGSYSEEGLKPYVGNFKPQQIIEPGETVVAQTDLTQAAEVVGRATRVPSSQDFDCLVASLDLAIVRPRRDVPPEFLLGVMQDLRFKQHCEGRTSGTTVLHLGKGAIESFEAPNAPRLVQHQYAEMVRPVHGLQDALIRQNRCLADMRDALLPALISGRLRVKDAEKVVGEVV